MPIGRPSDDAAAPLPTWDDLLATVAEGHRRLVLETATGGRVVLIAEAELTQLEDLARGARAPGDLSLTAREREVLQLVADGLSGVDVAGRLGLATNTVAQHLAAVRRKLGVHSSAAAVVSARQRGLLPPG